MLSDYEQQRFANIVSQLSEDSGVFSPPRPPKFSVYNILVTVAFTLPGFALILVALVLNIPALGVVGFLASAGAGYWRWSRCKGVFSEKGPKQTLQQKCETRWDTRKNNRSN